MSDQPSSFSIVRTLAIVVPVVVIALVVQRYITTGLEQGAQAEIERNMLSRLLGPTAVGPESAISFTDADGDLVADAPADEDTTQPDKLVFSYIAGPNAAEGATVWQSLVDALGEKLGVPAELVSYETTAQQLSALAAGELHVTGFNTGAVPDAVASGFVPTCTFGQDDGQFGYRMQLVAPASSSLKDLADLKGKKVTFVRPDSNSGCKAALVLMMNEYQLLPERDYQWGFSMGHDASILGVAAGEIEAAPVASDIFERMAADGEVDASQVRIIGESERFPPAAIGFAFNLPAAWRESIRETLLSFPWAGSSLEGKVGGPQNTKFIAVNYKDDWANVRRIEEAVRKARSPAGK